jgi:hypothetical protein
MTGSMLYMVIGVLVFFALGGAAFAFAGTGGGKAKKRMQAVARPTASARREGGNRYQPAAPQERAGAEGA